MDPQTPASNPQPKSPSPAAGDVQKAQQFARQLSSDSFTERLTAQKELLQLGRASIEPLEFAAHSEDSEARLKANELLIALRGRGFMGINLDERDPDMESGAEGEETTRPSYVHVAGVATHEQVGGSREFPAKLSGIEMDDKILSVNGRPTLGVKDLMREVIEAGPARGALVLVDRKGAKMRFSMALTRNPLDSFPPLDLEKELDDANPSGVTKTDRDVLEQPAKLTRKEQIEESKKETESIVRDIKKLTGEIKVEVKKAEVEAKKPDDTEKKAAEVKKKDEDSVKK
jgi:hypothetical protein